MRVVALVSGGKDSCYNMLQCVAAGHDIVALANLRPENKDELDSYMYQTVGHEGIELYAEAMDLPLFRQSTHGVAVQQGQVYTPTPEDEVEDLYQLLRTVKEEVEIDAVAVGAILSDYQRIRVENVCNRLGLVPLAYLWRRNQEELLQEMIDCEISAIVIKVAALGLSPSKHLGITLGDLQPHILKMKEKYGLNVCGEGGEYETFTLDCPLFNKTIIIDEWETVIHSNDAIAPVGYLNFKNFHLVQKDSVDPELSMRDRLLAIPVKTWRELISDLDEDVTEKKLVGRGEGDEDSMEEGSSIAEDRPPDEVAVSAEAAAVATPDPTSANVSPSNPEAPALKGAAAALDPLQVVWDPTPFPDGPSAAKNEAGWTWFGGIVGHGEDSVLAIREALHKLSKLVRDQSLEMTDLVSVSLYVRNMAHYAEMNAEYIRVFSHTNPPTRVCVEAPLPPETPVLLEGLAFRSPCGASGYVGGDVTKHTMHVQSVSHWAPANIGPYSQAVRVGDIIYVAGQIPLVPGTMQLVSGGARKQCRLALRHVGRIVRAIDANTQLRDVVQGICYVTHPSYIPEARREWEKRTNNAIVDYVVVPQLPRGALLEWHIWAHRHNNRFEYEETGCCIGDFRVSIRRRWNYENNVSTVVSYVSHSGTGSLTASMDYSDGAARLSHESTPVLTPQPPDDEMSDEHLSEVICYTLAKLLRKTDAATVCYLRIFCKMGSAPSADRIHTVLARAEGFNIVHSIVPVCQLHNAHTFLSICGVRHN